MTLRDQVSNYYRDLDQAFYKLRKYAVVGSDEDVREKLVAFHMALGFMLNANMVLVPLDPDSGVLVKGKGIEPSPNGHATPRHQDDKRESGSLPEAAA